MLWPSFVLPVGSIYDERLDVRHTGMSPSEKRLYCFLSVSQRLSLQRFLKINVDHSRLLVEKNGFAQWVGSDPLRQPRQLPRQFFAVLALAS